MKIMYYSSEMKGRCPVCDTLSYLSPYDNHNFRKVECLRCGCFKVSRSFEGAWKAKILEFPHNTIISNASGWIRQSQDNDEEILVIEDKINILLNLKEPSPFEKANRLLLYFHESTDNFASKIVNLNRIREHDVDLYPYLGISWAQDRDELLAINTILSEKKYIEFIKETGFFKFTAIGLEKILEHIQKAFGKSKDEKPISTNDKVQNSSNVPSHQRGSQSIRNELFISYSHKDEKFLNDLRAHLKPLERTKRVYAWSDQQILPGSEWFNEIQKALTSAKVAVLLVTKDFLASDFIDQHELGPLLKSAAAGGIKILWVLVRDCNWEKTPLRNFQAAYPTKKPLAAMGAKRDSAWVEICRKIEETLNV